MKKIKLLRLPSGKCPYKDWLLTLPNSIQAKLDAYLERIARGGTRKNVKAVGDGVFEVKVNTGPGYRIYFSEVGNIILLILLGGDKASQRHDVERAKLYWREYNV